MILQRYNSKIISLINFNDNQLWIIKNSYRNKIEIFKILKNIKMFKRIKYIYQFRDMLNKIIDKLDFFYVSFWNYYKNEFIIRDTL